MSIAVILTDWVCIQNVKRTAVGEQAVSRCSEDEMTYNGEQ